MATTTTNFGWDIPQSTDLVKDGATAIAALGQDIDTAFVDFKGGTTGQVLKKTSNTDLDVEWGTASSGLTLINTTSFSGVSSQSFNDVFTTTYRNYQIVFDLTTTANTNITCRLRASGSDITAGNYSHHRSLSASSSASYSGTNSTGTSWVWGSANTLNNQKGGTYTMYAPELAKHTLFSGTHVYVDSEAGAGAHAGGQTIGGYLAATQVDGFSLIVSTGTISGAVSVFGFNL